jgi:hypothetical protein
MLSNPMEPLYRYIVRGLLNKHTVQSKHRKDAQTRASMQAVTPDPQLTAIGRSMEIPTISSGAIIVDFW